MFNKQYLRLEHGQQQFFQLTAGKDKAKNKSMFNACSPNKILKLKERHVESLNMKNILSKGKN